VGIGDTSSAMEHLHVKGGDIYITGTGIAIGRGNAGSTVGRIDHISELGGGSGTAIAVIAGRMDISVSEIDATAAYALNGATAVLRLFCNELSGTRTAIGGSTAKVWVPPTEMTNGQLIIGSTGVDPVVATLTDGANITTTTGAGSITVAVSGTTDHSLQVGNATGSLTSLGVATDGQIPIGSTGADPVLATLTAGAGIGIANAAGSITISATAAGFTWSVIVANQTAADDQGYLTNAGGVVDVALPAASSVGDSFQVAAMSAGGWTISQGAGQQIQIGNSTTTAGAGGSLASSSIGDWVTLVCTVANTNWICKVEQGNITVS